MIEKITTNVLKEILESALNEFYKKDAKSLLFVSGMERACVFRIGIYLQNIMNKHKDFKNLNLDCEYNKCFKEPKKTPRHINGVRPDLIIHKRNFNKYKPNNCNFMVIEFKGYWNKKTKKDIEKLEDFTSFICGYNYNLGAFVCLNKTDYKIEYYINGEQCNE